jgi:hypothetical protein
MYYPSTMSDFCDYPLTLEGRPEDGGFLAFFPTAPGCQTWGETYEAAVRNKGRSARCLHRRRWSRTTAQFLKRGRAPVQPRSKSSCEPTRELERVPMRRTQRHRCVRRAAKKSARLRPINNLLTNQLRCTHYVLSVAMENDLVRSPRTRPDPARRSLDRGLEACASKEGRS